MKSNRRTRTVFIHLARCVLLLIPLASLFAFGQQVDSGLLPNAQEIFSQRCSKCHGERGEGVNAELTIAGPSLQAEHDPGQVMAAMEIGPSHMPSFPSVLSVQQMQAVAQYVTQRLAVIPLTGGDLSQGGKLFRVYCAPCHRTAVRGGALAFVGINAPALVHKSAAMVAGTIRFGPGPMPSFPPSVLDDKQLASVVDYVKYVQHPPSPGGSPLNWYGPVAEGFVGWVVVFGLLVITGWIERGGKG